MSAEFPIDFAATSCQSWNESERAKGDGGGNTFWLRVICANCTLLAQKTTFWCFLLSWWCLVRKMSMSFHKITCFFKRLPRFNLPLAYQCSLPPQPHTKYSVYVAINSNDWFVACFSSPSVSGHQCTHHHITRYDHRHKKSTGVRTLVGCNVLFGA